MIPGFLNFCLANRSLSDSQSYKNCQLLLLQEEIRPKKSNIEKLQKELEHVRSILSESVSVIDYTHICTLFITSNKKIIKRKDKAHEKKLHKLNINKSNAAEENLNHDHEKVFFNFSSYNLSTHEKSLLCKGLNFEIPPRNIEYSKFLLPFELLFREVKTYNLSDQDLSFRNFKTDSDCPENLSDEEFKSFNSLIR